MRPRTLYLLGSLAVGLITTAAANVDKKRARARALGAGVPAGWRRMLTDEVTPALEQQAIEILNAAHIRVEDLRKRGAMFVQIDDQHGALVEMHAGGKKGVSLVTRSSEAERLPVQPKIPPQPRF